MITVGENYRLKSDSHQWILQVRRVGKNPKTKEEIENWNNSYHPNIIQVANKIVEFETREANDWAELLVKINESATLLANAINKVLEEDTEQIVDRE